MVPENYPTVKYLTPLRLAQRSLTRGRIRDAARELFYERHYDATTMDEIALAAGLRRPTLYLHYKDKAEILTDIMADYAPKARSFLGTLPGPDPTVQQLQVWVEEVTTFVARERVPLSIIMEVRRRSPAHMTALKNLTGEILAGLGQNNPSFREAAQDNADPLLRARALLLLQELIYACELSLDNTDKALASALLRATAEDFHAFLTRPET